MDLLKTERVSNRNYKKERQLREKRGNFKAMNPKAIQVHVDALKAKAHEEPTVSNSVIEEAKRLSEEKGVPFTLHPNMCKILHRNFQLRRSYKPN